MSILRPRSKLFITSDIEELGEIISQYNQNRNDDLFLRQLALFSERFKDPRSYSRTLVEKLGSKQTRTLGDPITSVFDSLYGLPGIENEKILNNPQFIEYFYSIFWTILKAIGYATQNLYDWVEEYIDILNGLTIPNYVIYDCRSTHPYNCGRAMISIEKGSSRFVVFNTGADEDVMDQNVISDYLGNTLEIPFKSTSLSPDLFSFYKKASRIYKELSRLESEYKIQVLETKNPAAPVKVVMIHRQDPIKIVLHFPTDYPYISPFGSYNGLTISDADILVGCDLKTYNPRCNIKRIIDYLRAKLGTKQYIRVPTRGTFDSLKVYQK